MIDLIKIVSYITTLWPLCLYLAIKMHFASAYTVIFIIATMLIFVQIFIFKTKITKYTSDTVQIKVSNLRKDRRLTFDFLVMNVFPILAFQDGQTANLMVTFILVLVMGFLYVKNDLFYINAIYDFIGVHVYEADVRENNSSTILSNKLVIYPTGIYDQSKALMAIRHKNIYLVKRKVD